MKKLNRGLALLLALVMVVGLCACGGKQVTAQSLVEGMNAKITEDTYMMLDMDATIHASDGSTTADMSMKTPMELCKGVMHASDLTLSISSSGMSMEVTGEIWSDEDYTYTRMTMMGMDSGWSREESNGDAVMDLSSMMEDKYEPVLEEHKKGTDYVVTWTIPVSELSELMGGMDGFINGIGSVSDAKDGSVTVTASFDEKTQDVKALSFSTGDLNVDDSTISMDISMVFTTIGGDKTLTVPDDVKTEAEAAESESEYEFDWTDDAADDDKIDEDGSISDLYGPLAGSDIIEGDLSFDEEELIGIARNIEAKDPNAESILLYKYYNNNEVAWYTSTGPDGDWYCCTRVMKYFDVDDETGKAAARYDYDWNVEYYTSEYENVETYGDTETVFWRIDSDGELNMVYLYNSDEFLTEYHIYADDTDDINATVPYINILASYMA